LRNLRRSESALVRRIFGAPENAAAQFRATLPSALLAQLDLRSLRVEDPASVVEVVKL